MDVFDVRKRLIDDYSAFTASFVEVRDRRVYDHVQHRLAEAHQWPDPWLSLNPSYASGGTISELVAEGLLHPTCAQIFRLPPRDPGDEGVLRLHSHQRRAIELARAGRSFVLTTGTGSGKSLGYIIPVVDRIVRAKAAGQYRSGLKAMIVYPMNALANSQRNELEKFLRPEGVDSADPPVTFERYTGQESNAERQAILANPPDILLTNYVMAELLLTRPRERSGLIGQARELEFFVLDELHSYRGRQGADVAMLVRRLRNACRSDVQCIGLLVDYVREFEYDSELPDMFLRLGDSVDIHHSLYRP